MLWLAPWKVWSLGYEEIDYNSLAGRGDTLLAFYTAGAETLKVARLEGDEWVQEGIAVDSSMRHPRVYWASNTGVIGVLSKRRDYRRVVVYIRDTGGEWHREERSLTDLSGAT